MKKDIIVLGLVLAAFSAGACVALAFVYSVTGPTIAGLEKKQLEQSLKEMFPSADSFDPAPELKATDDPAVSVDGAFVARQAGGILGMAIKASGNSYGGRSTLLIGVQTDRRIAGVKVLDIKDTPGLGLNAKNPAYFVDKSSKTTFPGQFAMKPLTDAFVVKEDVVAISASTITSRALTNIVKKAGDASLGYLEKLAQGVQK